MAYPAPAGGALTGAGLSSVTTTGYSSDATLSPAIQTIWSKEILFQAMPVLRFEQFAVKKTELGVMPGLTINFTSQFLILLPLNLLKVSVWNQYHFLQARSALLLRSMVKP